MHISSRKPKRELLQPDLPGNAYHTLSFDVSRAPVVAQPAAAVRVQQTPSGVAVDTGPLSFLVPTDGYAPVSEVRLNGEVLWQDPLFGGFCLTYDGQQAITLDTPIELEVEEAGPLRAVILVTGKAPPGSSATV